MSALKRLLKALLSTFGKPFCKRKPLIVCLSLERRRGQAKGVSLLERSHFPLKVGDWVIQKPKRRSHLS